MRGLQQFSFLLGSRASSAREVDGGPEPLPEEPFSSDLELLSLAKRQRGLAAVDGRRRDSGIEVDQPPSLDSCKARMAEKTGSDKTQEDRASQTGTCSYIYALFSLEEIASDL